MKNTLRALLFLLASGWMFQSCESYRNVSADDGVYYTDREYYAEVVQPRTKAKTVRKYVFDREEETSYAASEAEQSRGDTVTGGNVVQYNTYNNYYITTDPDELVESDGDTDVHVYVHYDNFWYWYRPRWYWRYHPHAYVYISYYYGPGWGWYYDPWYDPWWTGYYVGYPYYYVGYPYYYVGYPYYYYYNDGTYYVNNGVVNNYYGGAAATVRGPRGKVTRHRTQGGSRIMHVAHLNTLRTLRSTGRGLRGLHDRQIRRQGTRTPASTRSLRDRRPRQAPTVRQTRQTRGAVRSVGRTLDGRTRTRALPSRQGNGSGRHTPSTRTVRPARQGASAVPVRRYRNPSEYRSVRPRTHTRTRTHTRVHTRTRTRSSEAVNRMPVGATRHASPDRIETYRPSVHHGYTRSISGGRSHSPSTRSAGISRGRSGGGHSVGRRR